MKYTQILSQLWCEPTLLTPGMHAQLCDIVEAHISGAVGALPADEQRSAAAMKVEDGIARIPLQGVIGRHVSAIQESSGVTDVDRFAAMVAEADADETVRGVLLDIDSPGGGVTRIPEVAEMVKDLAAVKPVLAYTDGDMASAAYWIGSQASLVMASQSATVGSIGVYMAWLDESRQFDMQGIRTELIKAGKYKATGVRGIALTDDQRDMLQARVDEIYGWFADAVGDQRPDVTGETMQGQVFHGPDAAAVGLIDAVSERGGAMDALAELM